MRDDADPSSAPRRVVRRLALRLVALCALVVVAVLSLPKAPETPTLRFEPTPRLADRVRAGAPMPPPRPMVIVDAASAPTPVLFESGQTLGGLLGRLGVPASQQATVVDALAEHLDPRRIRPGVAGLAYRDPDGGLNRLRLRLGNGWVELDREDENWRARLRAFQRRVDVARAAGEVDGPLEPAVRSAGAPAAVAYAMAYVLRWDLDFNRDLRTGDRFEVLYEKILLDDSFAGPGDILALSYENRGVRYEAYRFEDAYYDAEGRPLQKMFLRSPLPFTRVTSRFSRSRMHPVLKVRRPHWGVDYGAPTGTPVRVTAAGAVTLAGRNGGAGNMVEVRHVAGYRTAYLHLSRFAKGIRRGRRVAQGDIIGYVGSTGLSTGPHLDYRVKKDGRWIDPLSIHQTPSEPIPAAQMAAFQAQRDRLRRQLADPSAVPVDAALTQLAQQGPVAATLPRPIPAR